jgi:hypothetical protein
VSSLDTIDWARIASTLSSLHFSDTLTSACLPSEIDPMNALRIAVGLTFWCGLLTALGLVVTGHGNGSRWGVRQLLSSLSSSYSSAGKLEVRVPESCILSVGDPVFATDADGAVHQIGIVLSNSEAPDCSQTPDGILTVQAVLFSSAPRFATPIRAQHFNTPDSTVWIVQTLLPPGRRKQIENELAVAFDEHREEIFRTLQPVVDRSVRRALFVIQHDLPPALDKHRTELQTILARDKEEILRKELLPLLKAEVWPIIRRDSEPLLRQMTAELWERASIWSLAWRGAADKMPLLRGRNRLESELVRFLDQEGIPTCQRHEEDFLALLETIVQDLAANDRIKAAFKQSFAKVADDPELENVLNSTFHEVVVQNPRLWQSIRDSLASTEAQDAVRLTSTRLEPAIHRVAGLILGSREEGLTPEFNQVLRHQVLLKDRHGIILGEIPTALHGLPTTIVEASYSGPTS